MRSVVLLLVTVLSLASSLKGQQPGTNVLIDGSKRGKDIDGFGVNINTAWWYDGKYSDAEVVQPAIDLLVDSLGASIFRAVIEEIDWEAENDNGDPDNYNWTFYDSIFSGIRFQGVWNTLRYLNKKGISKNLVISLMGAPPAGGPLEGPDPNRSWMGNTNYSVDGAGEDELAESIAALLYYMRYKAKIEFTLVSPMNETDVISRSKSAEHPDGIVEGPNIPDALQYIRVIKKLGKKLDALGMDDIRFVAPDAAWDGFFTDFLNNMVNDSYLMDKLACWGVHQYGDDARNYRDIVSNPSNTNSSFWVTETAGIENIFGQLDDDAGAYLYWDGFDCVYQHGRRNGYGSVPPNDYVFWIAGEAGKPLIEYMAADKCWRPRKQFYQNEQLMKFIRPGAARIGVTEQDTSLAIFAFRNTNGQLVITGRNKSGKAITIDGTLANLPVEKTLKMIYTSSTEDFVPGNDVSLSGNSFRTIIPPDCVFTLTGSPDSEALKKPEPESWYAGDIHIHRNCGEVTSITPENELATMMKPNDLAVISVLADMGNGEVKDSRTDLPKVNGKDASCSEAGRIVHWDAEWHFDPAGVTFEHKALGGHLVLLGLNEAHQIWDESPWKIIEWGKARNAIVGFCHMEYLNDSVQSGLNCCIPVDYPVETALGTIDFLSEDVWINDAAVKGYYRLLNCGFRPGWAAGTDFPCNNSRPFGSLLTYVQVKDKPLTYRKWIEGIRNGRTVVSTNGHNEFIDMKINGVYGPGDEIRLKEKGVVNAEITWTSKVELTGRIEIICNGKVVATKEGSVLPGGRVVLKTGLPVDRSSWICARRMDISGHRTHTAPVYVTINDKPVRADAEDAKYFIRWIDNILSNISPGKPWDHYFTHDKDIVRQRYQKAKAVYEKIAREAETETQN
jgi:O-glycosyl hydrolase